MKHLTGKRHVCSRGHVFYKSSDCPVCPKCWSGYYRKKKEGNFPKTSALALRALLNAKITSLKQLTKIREEELLELHGMGPKAVSILRAVLKVKRWSFKR